MTYISYYIFTRKKQRQEILILKTLTSLGDVHNKFHKISCPDYLWNNQYAIILFTNLKFITKNTVTGETSVLY